MSNHTNLIRTRYKICGLTEVEDALLAADYGADSIGLVFHQASPRFIALEKALEIKQAMPAFVTVTALFLNESEQWVQQVLDQVQPDCLQFHGSESAAYCEQWGEPYIKAIPMGDEIDANSYASRYRHAQGFLMDSNVAGRQGGSGDTFDWSKIPSTFEYPLILAGGLNPENVAEAILKVQPWAVDVSSGVEKSKGVKDSHLIKEFCKEVVRVNSEN